MEGSSPRLHDYLRRNARYFGDRVAVRFENDEITYSGLLQKTEQVARLLDTKGLRKGERVGVWMENSIAWIAIFLTCSRLGLVAIPINTRLTREEMAAIVSASRARLVFASRGYRRRDFFAEAEGAHYRSVETPAVVGVDPATPPDRWVFSRALPQGAKDDSRCPDDVLAIQFTSGTTTGTPKGVMLTNRNYIGAADYAAKCLLMTPASEFIGGATFFHTSGSMHCISACLVTGCTLNSMTIWDPEYFLDAGERFGCSVAHAPFFADIMALPRKKTRAKLEPLQRTTAAGESPASLRAIIDELDIPGLATLYGMTETCGNFTMWFPDDPIEMRVALNGRPELGNEIRITHPETRDVLKADAIGEIEMRGWGITPGYFENPAAMAAAFTENGWFRSGDSGYVTERGELAFLGRYKDIIRVGGENMTPTEAEHVMLETGHFGEVCVLALPDPRLNEIPVAVVIQKTNVEDWPSLVSQIRTRLADYKVPRHIYLASELPRTEATRRIQRSILQSWVSEGRLKRVV
jgi:acyl-CoA synthetase (AMP-forming)/AMP-acid ligase II